MKTKKESGAGRTPTEKSCLHPWEDHAFKMFRQKIFWNFKYVNSSKYL